MSTVRLWKEGRRIYEDEPVAVECDGATVTITDDEGEETYSDDEWDELTVN